jgi:hypothetical protein
MTSAAGRTDPAALKSVVLAELSVRSEEKSAVQAFNAATARWKTPPLTHLKRRQSMIRELQREAAIRNLEITLFSGSLDDVMSFDHPALLSFAVPAAKAEHVIAMTGSGNGQLRISPPLVGRASFSGGEFLPLWPGRAYLVWRNYEKIPPTARGARGERVKKIQGLLQKSGSPELERDGIYEAATVDAVKAFQSARRIRATGTLDPLTLMMLYRAAGYPEKSDRTEDKGRP